MLDEKQIKDILGCDLLYAKAVYYMLEINHEEVLHEQDENLLEGFVTLLGWNTPYELDNVLISKYLREHFDEAEDIYNDKNGEPENDYIFNGKYGKSFRDGHSE